MSDMNRNRPAERPLTIEEAYASRPRLWWIYTIIVPPLGRLRRNTNRKLSMPVPQQFWRKWTQTGLIEAVKQYIIKSGDLIIEWLCAKI